MYRTLSLCLFNQYLTSCLHSDDIHNNKGCFDAKSDDSEVVQNLSEFKISVQKPDSEFGEDTLKEISDCVFHSQIEDDINNKFLTESQLQAIEELEFDNMQSIKINENVDFQSEMKSHYQSKIKRISISVPLNSKPFY